jgi:putative ABC transport system permease protein
MMNDLRLALRSLLRSPGFLVTAVGSLAIAIGVAIGMPVAMFSARLIGSLLYTTSPRDPLVYGSVVACIAVVSLVAAFIPARRAVRVDPIVALEAGE